MEINLIEIFALRNALLKRLNGKFYRKNEQTIRQSSLAAQDLYFSGDLDYIENCSLHELSHNSIYENLHTEYHLPYNTNNANIGLVFDLACALKSDIKSNIISPEGAILSRERLNQEANTLKIFHNTMDSGIPADAFKTMNHKTYIKFFCDFRKEFKSNTK